ncbi:MAG: hypothetical protein P8R54_07215 [Myxococcota bacterium]|nr:hypothetical protein [Myxococcota bacterium]
MLALLVLAAQAASPVTMVDVVVDPATVQVYIPAVGRSGLRALQITDGTARWHRPEATTPLTVAPGILIAQASGPAGTLTVLSLDAATGDIRQRCDGPVPDWLVTTPGRSHSHVFAIQAVMLDADTVDVFWAGRTWWGEGEDPGEAILAASRHSDSGAFRCDLTTGRTRRLRANPPLALEVPAAVTLGSMTLRLGTGPILAPPPDRSLGVVVSSPEQRRTLQAVADGAVVWDVLLPSREPHGDPPP